MNATETQSGSSLDPLVLRVANRLTVPLDVARCPECDGQLWWQVATTDGLNDLMLDCENESDEDASDRLDEEHRWWQGEWEPVINKVKRWILSSQNEIGQR
jgi:hypothetical protein